MRLTKKIRIYWDQGFEKAPKIVKACAKSWIKYNPTWEVVLLDRDNIKPYFDINTIVDIDRPDLTIQKISNLIRVNLLSQYGGVWSDATCLCRKPLDEWLLEYMTSGFFAFRDPGKDRILSNWFLASTPDCHLIKNFAKAHNDFFSRNIFTNQNSRLGEKVVRKLKKKLRKDTKRSRWWLHPIIVNLLKVYPYFIFHYHFEKIIYSDKLSKNIWESSVRFPADIPHSVRKLGLTSAVTPNIIESLKDIDSPLYKLDWRVDGGAINQETIIGYLINKHGLLDEGLSGGLI